MGQQHEYKCPQCSYEAFVSGGMDFGFETVLVTISCRECAELFDAVADEKSAEILGAGEDEERAEPSGIARPKNAKHTFDLWEGPGKCPKCGTKMIVGRPGSCWD